MANTFNNGQTGLAVRTILNNNATEITAATANIATNTTNIATNTTNIATNTTAIATLNTTVSSHTTSIATNATAITNLTTTVPTGLAGKQNKDAVSTLFCVIRATAIDFTLATTDKNTLFVVTNVGATQCIIPLNLGAGFDSGGHCWIYNHSTSSNNITIAPAGGVTVRGSVTITPGQTVKIDRLGTNEYSNNTALPLILSTIAALTPSNDDIIQWKTGAPTNRTVAQYKADLTLNNCDNTSDINKPVSTAQATAIGLKQTANADNTLNDVIKNSSSNVTVGNTDNNNFWNINTAGANKTFTINTGLTMAIGSQFGCYNSAAAGNHITVNGTATNVYANALTATIQDGEAAWFKKIAADTYLRVW